MKQNDILVVLLSRELIIGIKSAIESGALSCEMFEIRPETKRYIFTYLETLIESSTKESIKIVSETFVAMNILEGEN